MDENTGGALDASGFFLESSLEPGASTLELTGVPGAAFTVHLEQAPAANVPSDDLLACLINGGLMRTTPAALRRLSCPSQGLSEVTGLDAFTGLYAVDLRWNVIADLTPLMAPFLRVLMLDGNPLNSLTPLETLTGLTKLSLAHTRLEPLWLGSLHTLGTRLGELDLTGVTGIGAGDLLSLRAALPTTRIVAPDGALMP